MDKICDNCMVKKRGDCAFGRDLCESYKPIPYVSQNEKDNWPKEFKGGYYRTPGHKSYEED